MKFETSTKTLVAVVLPLAILFAWWLRMATVVSSGQIVGFGVSGYDPRDLLSGHYLTYQVQYVPSQPCQELNQNESVDGQEICLCFGSESNQTTWQGSCKVLPTSECGRYLRGYCQNNRFEAGIERYYIPEGYASSDAIPEQSYIIVSLDGKGGGIVKDFMVGNIPLLDWLRQKSKNMSIE